MKLIRRFDLVVEPTQKINIPFNSELLRFGTWDKKPCVWAIVDTNYSANHSTQMRTFFMIADNKEVPVTLNKTNYMGSFECQSDVGEALVHVFSES